MTAWLISSFAACILTSFAVWSRYPTRARGITVLALLMVVPLSGVTMLVQRGWSAPLVAYLVDLPEGKMEVVGVYLVPETAIHLTLLVGSEPRLFVLPWSAGGASQLQRLMEGGAGGGKIKAKKRTGKTRDDEFPLELHGEPQPSLPEKMPEQSFEYERQ